MVKKHFWVFPLVIAFFIYGVLVGTYEIFPFRYIKDGKDLLDRAFMTETTEPIIGSTQSTFLQRLLIKKVKVGDKIGNGGGISNSGSVLFLVTNKGKIKVYDIDNYEELNVETEDVPLNLEGLINSAIMEENGPEMISFRVNGVYSEQINSSEYRLYVSHNSFDSTSNCIFHNISTTDFRVDIISAKQENQWQTIFSAEPCIDPKPEYYLSSHPFEGAVSGGNILEFNENQLLATVGSYMRHGLNNSDAYSMDLSNPYGKTILIDKKTGEWSIYSFGHRNAAGLYIDENGTIWSTENGPLGGDELNIIERDKNYGWPLVSLGVWYNPSFRLEGGQDYGRHKGYQKPHFAWTYSIAPANLVRIEGDKFRYWSGDLIVGTRADNSLRRLRLNDSLQVINDEKIELGHRVRDLTTLQDGTIVIFTDDGHLLFVDDGGSSFHEMGTTELERLQNLNKFKNFNATY